MKRPNANTHDVDAEDWQAYADYLEAQVKEKRYFQECNERLEARIHKLESDLAFFALPQQVYVVIRDWAGGSYPVGIYKTRQAVDAALPRLIIDLPESNFRIDVQTVKP